MRNRFVTAFVLLVGMMAVGSATEAQVFVGPGGPVTLNPGYGYRSAYVPPAYVPSTATGYVAPYSYYAVPPSVAARTYIGPALYPFYGRPYGHPFDRWTWPYISGGPNADLARYFYPPVQ